MKPTARAALNHLADVFTDDSPPTPVSSVLVQIVESVGWCATTSEAEELAERLYDGFHRLLRREFNDLVTDGRIIPYQFSTDSLDIIQGSAFVVVDVDSAEVVELKRGRSLIGSYLTGMEQLSARQFEAMCRGILVELGVVDPVLTPASRDEGIDFFGRLPIPDKLLGLAQLPGVHRRLSVWLVGQAKHFQKGQVVTADIRELVGSVTLARGRAFGSGLNKYRELRLLVCDPVFYMFLTTGAISPDSWRVIRASGVIGMDGRAVAAFLADHRIGLGSDGKLDLSRLGSWLAEHLVAGR